MNTSIEKNRASWNRFTPLHLESDFYANEKFLAGAQSLNSPELELLGDVQGLRILHLQCHFGQDSISLARMGAKVTAIDFSSVAISAGIELARSCGVEVEFIESDVLSRELLKDRQFDLVFTSYGAIPWIENLQPWAEQIDRWLAPAGRFVMVEFHPVMQMLDDDKPEFVHSYFGQGSIQGRQQGSYAVPDTEEEFEYCVWNHPLDEVMGALLGQDFHLRAFREYDYSPYDCFPGTIALDNGGYQLAGKEGILPMVYGLALDKA